MESFNSAIGGLQTEDDPHEFDLQPAACHTHPQARDTWGAEPVASDQDPSGSFEIAMAIGASACNEQSL